MHVEGFDLRVGERPKPASYGTLYDFNKVFLQMFNYFEQEHDAIEVIWLEQTPLGWGNLTLSQVRNWLKYHQLISVEKFKEPLPEPNGPFKNRTKYILKPTKHGYQAYVNGWLIELDVANETFKVGVGKPYPTWDALYGLATVVWQRHGISMSRQEKWFSELKEKYLSMLDRAAEEAVKEIKEWSTHKAQKWNRNRKVRVKPKIKNPAVNPVTGNVVLEKGQQTLLESV